MRTHAFRTIGLGMLGIRDWSRSQILSSFAKLSFLSSELDIGNDRVGDLAFWEKELKALSNFPLSPIELLKKEEFDNKLKFLIKKYSV